MKICAECGQIVAEEVNTCPTCGSEVAAGRARIDDYRILEASHILSLYPAEMAEVEKEMTTVLNRLAEARRKYEPLLASGRSGPWRLAWSSEAINYGGQGTPPVDPAGDLRLPGECALLFTSAREGRE